MLLRIIPVIVAGVVLGLGVYIARPKAQSGGGALVVQTCGVLPQAFTAGSTRSLTVDVNGNTC
jgi:hypothetical protein